MPHPSPVAEHCASMSDKHVALAVIFDVPAGEDYRLHILVAEMIEINDGIIWFSVFYVIFFHLF